MSTLLASAYGQSKECLAVRNMNAKQRRFAEEYLKDLNATQAAIRAGYSERTAYSQGQRLLKNVEIKNAIKEVRERIQNENIATIKDIEEFLSMSMNGEIDEEVVVTVGTGEGYSEAVKVRKEISTRDRLKAADLLGKRYGLYTDKVDMTQALTIVFEDDYGDSEDY